MSTPNTVTEVDAAPDRVVAFTYYDAASPIDSRIHTRVTSSASLGLSYTDTYTYAGSTGNYYLTATERS